MRVALGKAMDGYSEQASAFLASRGVDAAAFQAWARTEFPSEFKAAMIGHVQHRSVASYAHLADRYMTNLDKIDPQRSCPGLSTRACPLTTTLAQGRSC